ncbi:MAG: decaprenyl-phosphate phosphoribosyltransferase [Candidatus Hydrogenedentes bacterium]|nr:decaprenyl-phosphate phosphoribosyltransferase [Candidatus Hydrogenedentota bacterium]
MFNTLVKALRVYQWSKNLLVFAALLFAQQLQVPGQLFRSLVAFVAFCAASSAIYLFNDIMDIENDRAHPEKCTRPLASGAMSIRTAVAMIVGLLALAAFLAGQLNAQFFAILAFYVVLIIFYSLVLKRLVIVDVMVVAIGFVIRAMAGAIALSVTFSNWLVVCTMFLALFLGFSKRRHEIRFLNEGATNHRPVLLHYTIPYLESLNIVVAGATLITYTIYTCSPEVVLRLGTDKLYLTLPFVVYGLFRYLYLVQQNLDGGDPSSSLLKDKPLTATVVLWAVACTGIIYWKAAMHWWRVM